MTAYPVRKTGKLNGEITAIGDDSWGSRSKADAISDILLGRHTYFVPWTTGSTQIQVVNGTTGRYLRTDHDAATRNNLLDLPDLSGAYAR